MGEASESARKQRSKGKASMGCFIVVFIGKGGLDGVSGQSRFRIE